MRDIIVESTRNIMQVAATGQNGVRLVSHSQWRCDLILLQNVVCKVECFPSAKGLATGACCASCPYIKSYKSLNIVLCNKSFNKICNLYPIKLKFIPKLLKLS